jgi:cell wall-associated NlpC family hydrolase
MTGAIALAVLASACASTGATPKPFPMPHTPAAPVTRAPESGTGRPAAVAPGSHAAAPDTVDVPTASSDSANIVVRTALHLRGIRYRNGGSDPSGFDCSGFTQYVFAQAGAALPRDVHDQFLTGAPVQPGDLRPGDLIFFTTTAPGASHVGIAIGGDGFVHAPSSRGVVRVETLSLPYWSTRLVGIRRVAAN